MIEEKLSYLDAKKQKLLRNSLRKFIEDDQKTLGELGVKDEETFTVMLSIPPPIHSMAMYKYGCAFSVPPDMDDEALMPWRFPSTVNPFGQFRERVAKQGIEHVAIPAFDRLTGFDTKGIDPEGLGQQTDS